MIRGPDGHRFDLALIWLVAALLMVLVGTYGDWSRVLWWGW